MDADVDRASLSGEVTREKKSEVRSTKQRARDWMNIYETSVCCIWNISLSATVQASR